MPLSRTDSRNIIEGVFCQPDLPDDLRQQFAQWMLAHEDDPTLHQVLRDIWDALPDGNPAESAAGLRQLLLQVGSLDAAGGHGGGRRLSGLRRALAVAAVAAAVFAAGWAAALALRGGHAPEGATTTLVASPQSPGHHTLPDGTEVWLNHNSTLTYAADFNRRDRLVALVGEAYFEVAHDSRRPFRVALDSMQVEVTGTAFDAINYPDAPVRVALRSGRINITGAARDIALAMSPDNMVTRQRGQSEISVVPVVSDNYCSWMARKLRFDNRRLGDILTNIERRYAVAIVADPALNLDKRLSLTIGDETLEETSRLLEMLLSIKVEIDGNHATLRCGAGANS